MRGTYPGLTGVYDLIASAPSRLAQVGLRPREEDAVAVPVPREGYPADAQRHMTRRIWSGAGEGNLLDVGAEPLRDTDGIGAFRVQQEHRESIVDASDAIRGAEEFLELTGQRALDLLRGSVGAIDVQLQQTYGEKVLISRRSRGLVGQEMAEGRLGEDSR